MQVKTINATHADFKRKADNILELYNQESHSPFDEVLNVNKPESLNLVYVEGVEGGVITDRWCNSSGEFLFNSIMFAAFPQQERRKGHLKACLQNAGFPIETVQINGGDPIDIWRKLGFTKIGTLGMTVMMRTRDFPNIHWGVCVL